MIRLYFDPHRRHQRIGNAGTARLLPPRERPGAGAAEIGPVGRTLFTLDWIERSEERRQATRELNKGEAQNALKRAIFFHRTGRIRDHDLQAQDTATARLIWSPTRSRY